ncbi:hypothetical protein [Fimbriimonas ginsengisoli]|uniref:Uncharacterized protein n=1 Tax=Fimbriimonas ginsengisoli Gsoil 348 TaxID=661478 RepID=A0A068NLD6_FIMGI|nr:hypothetical protein [Fimbriimonas ginsengisoli]AIE84296.1 hypothetical protein OP10G_0928 [Fimbriimonas ginsengisoli Gsoil 348]
MPGTNKYLEAFKESYNAIGLAAAVALSAGTLSLVPILGVLVLEAAYLLFVPDSKWYDARLSARYDQEVIQRRRKLADEVFPSLSADVKTRFVRLETVREQVGGPLFKGKRWFQEVLRKLDYLLEKFLLFATKQVQFENYLRSVLEEVERTDPSRPPRRRATDPAAEPMKAAEEEWVKRTVARIQERYDEDIESIRTSLPGEENLHNQAVLEKRKEILMRRKQYVGQMGEILVNLGQQLCLIEDTFGLINDEIRARSPEQVLVDIEDVVYQSDSLSETLQEVSPFDQMPVAAGAGRLYNVEENQA